LFSVVIPLYNKGQTIVDTVQSVLSQDFADFEVIIVDDGSTDDGPEKVDRCFDDPRIRMIRQENSGEGAARNTGIQAARYDLIAPLDADDEWLPGYLSEVARAINAFPDAGMFCCGGVGRYPDGSGIVRKSTVYGSNPSEINYFEAPYFFGNASSIVFAKKLVSLAGAFPTAMTQQADVVFFFRLALVTKAVFCPALFSIYNLGIPGQISSDRRANASAAVDSSNQIYQFWDTLDTDFRNPACIVAVVNNLRCGFRYPLLNSDYELINFFFTNTDERLLRKLATAERFIYPRPRLRRIALLLNRIWLAIPHRISRAPSATSSQDVMQAIRDTLS
jgi:glycosyltransferase involved in cell wall biosynthesis